MTAFEAERELAAMLKPAAGEEAALEAKFLLRHCHGKRYSPGTEIPEKAFEKALALVPERLEGKPLQYVLGEWEFMGFSFDVGPGVLIPRPETELLTELALKQVEKNVREKQVCRVLDVCTGTGAIGLSLHLLGSALVTLSDISPEALSYARRNVMRHKAFARLLQGDLFEPLVPGETFDVITCNPPYLTKADMASRQKELYFEPETALYGGEDGLDIYRRLAREADARLTEGGYLFMEIGSTEGGAVQAMFPGSTVYKDLAGLDRVVVYQKK